MNLQKKTEDFIDTENRIIPNFMDDTETASEEHVNKLEVSIVLNTGMIVLSWNDEKLRKA